MIGSRIMRMQHFHIQSDPFALNKNFSWKHHYYSFCVLLDTFHHAKLKNNHRSGSRIMKICYFWAKNGLFPPDIIFQKPINKPYSFNSCLSRFNKLKSDVNLLIKFDKECQLESHWPRAILAKT